MYRKCSLKSNRYIHCWFLLLPFVLLPGIAETEPPPGAKPLKLSISREHPLIIFQGRAIRHSEPDLIINDWQNHVPDDLKPYCIFQIEVRDLNLERRYSTYLSILDKLEDAKVPVCLQVMDPHPKYTLPLRYVVKLIERYDCILAVQATENRTAFYDPIPEVSDIYTPPEISYMIDLIKLGAKNGLAVSLQHQGLRWLHIGSDALCKKLRHTLETYRAYVLPQNEHIGNRHLPRQTSVWGFWMADVVDRWGIEAQSWWWQNAHFIEPGVYGRCPDDWPTRFPKGIYRPMILQAAMLGATVYAFEPNWDLFEYARPDVWYDDILPTLREVVHRGLISSKEELLEKTKIAYQVSLSESIADFHRISKDVDWMADEGLLAKAAYGLFARGIEHELIPNKNDTFFIPVLPLHAKETVKRHFRKIIEPGECESVEEYEQLLARYEPEPDTEAAYVEQVGQFIHVMQTHENLYERQGFSINVPIAVRGIEARKTEENRYLLKWPAVEGAQEYQVCKWINQRSKPDDHPVEASWSSWDVSHTVDQPKVEINTIDGDIIGIRAKTKKKERLESTVNFLDCLVFDTECSRIKEIIEFQAGEKHLNGRSRRFLDSRPTSQEWFDLGKGLSEEHRATAEEVKSTFKRFITYYEKEEIEELSGFYAAGYRDPNGYDRDYVLRAWLWWFQRMYFPYCTATIHEWDTSKYASDGIIRMKLVGFWRGVMIWDEPWGFDGLARFPRHDSIAVWWSWKRSSESGRWEIITTDPACPNFGEMLWNSRGHAYSHTMDKFRDGPKPW